jgi:TolB protein
MKKIAVILSMIVAVQVMRAAEEPTIIIDRERDSLGFAKPVPVSVAGFSGEADSVLRFDLSFMGFEFVAPDKARYNIQKNSAAGVGASVTDPLMPAASRMIYNKSFTGGTTRQQTHALADDLAKTLTGKPGIAQTRIACKVQQTGYGAGEIVIADYDGFNATPVTKDGVICAAPSWAGRNMLYYMSHKIANKPDVLSHNLGTGARKRITTTTGDNFTPAASPDGRRVAMILSKSGSPNLYVSDADGGNLKQLTTTRDGESSPAWSASCRARPASRRSTLFPLAAAP